MLMLNRNSYMGRMGLRVLALSVMLGVYGSSFAMPPHPDVQEKIIQSAGGEEAYKKQLAEERTRGIDQPDNYVQQFAAKRSSQTAQAWASPFRVLVLLADFSDKASQVNASLFDGLIFDSTGSSVRTYYDEISYSQFDLVTLNMPSTTGWNRLPQTYAYYVDGAYGLGAYPNNAQKMTEDLVDLANGSVDFSQYDNDGDGWVDALVIVHAGPGREFTGNDNDIHSHKWGITPRLRDGVYISSYTVQPEYLTSPGDATIGVFCHELGHVFGLPDLYDTDYSSNGVGAWCLMAFGSWNGYNGNSPSHPSAWCRKELGFGTVTNVSSNRMNQSINAVETGGSIYRMWTNGDSTSSEYFLIENRQRTGYDAGLVSSGMLIWHIDESKINNDAEWWPGLSAANHYLVALEQADGLREIEHNTNSGNSGDVYPGSTANTSFSNITSPSSASYESGATVVAINNISGSGPTMTADLVVGISARVDDYVDGLLPASAELAQNYPNPFNPETQITFNLLQPGQVSLQVYNIGGQIVKTLLVGSAEVGTTTVTWNANNESGQRVSSGIYLYKLETEQGEEVKKMVLVR